MSCGNKQHGIGGYNHGMSGSSRPRKSRRSESIDELLAAMSNEHRRRVLYYLRRNHGTTSDDLVYHLAESTDLDPDAAASVLHHAILPRLYDIGAVDYDRDHDRVRYRGGSLTTEFVDWVMDRERVEGDR